MKMVMGTNDYSPPESPVSGAPPESEASSSAMDEDLDKKPAAREEEEDGFNEEIKYLLCRLILDPNLKFGPKPLYERRLV